MDPICYPAVHIHPKVLKYQIGVRNWFTKASLTPSVVRGDSASLFNQLVSTLNLDALEDKLQQFVESYFSWMKTVEKCQSRTRTLMLQMRTNDGKLSRQEDPELKKRLVERENTLKRLDKMNDREQNIAVSEMDRLEKIIRQLFLHTAAVRAGLANPIDDIVVPDTPPAQ